ncbi:MAG: enolase C-terminal domain-like protein [Thermoproteus sp. AZ2]|uniref:Enolase C-terminal domain-like protein n=1 Tax=Thermoproteus sp. AZ2 TaxID=1609232 RepID=A0ACC6V383_9CREN|nr:MAG: mandelate racemase [Thermoproteus sp. AZ2]
MKISDVRFRTIALPLKNKLLHSAGAHPHFVLTIVEVETTEGLIGYGETGGGGFSLGPFIGYLRRQMIGEDPFNIRRLRWKVASPITATYYNQLLPQLWFPLETALLDIKGRALGRPIHDLVGGAVRTTVEVSAYLFPVEGAETYEDLAKLGLSLVDRYGFKVVKLKAGVYSPPHDADTVKAMAAERPWLRFRIDPNGAWSLAEALYVAREMQRAGVYIEYFEDPVWTMEGMRAFKEATGYPLATNTVVTRFEDIPHAFLKRAVDIVLGDPHWWYGITGFLELSASLWALGLELGMHSPGESGIALAAMLHAAASAPNLAYAIDTHYIHLADDVLKHPLEISNGVLRAPEGPGLGVEVDLNKLDKYETLYRDLGDYPYAGDDVVTIPRRKYRECRCHR